MGFLKKHASKLITGLIVSVVLSFLGAAIFSNYYIDNHLLAKVYEESASTKILLPKIIEDLKILNKFSPFPVWSRKKNIEPLFTKNLGWEGKNVAELRSQSHVFLKALFDDHQNWNSNFNSFSDLAKSPLIDQIDTTWLEAVLDYDHFKISTYNIYQEQFKLAKGGNSLKRIEILSSLPIPRYQDLQRWAIVYLVKASRSQETILHHHALKIYRHLAMLSHSSSTLIGSMMAAKMLTEETTLVTYLNITGWKPVHPKIIQAYKAASWAWPGLIRLPFVSGLPAELEPYLKPQTGLCSSASEIPSGLILQDYLKPHFLFEKDFSMELARGFLFQKRLFDICDSSEYNVFVSDIPDEANPIRYTSFELDGQKFNPQINPVYIPFIRKFIGILLFSVSSPNFNKYYEEDSQKTTHPPKPNPTTDI